ncbi:MULTISPECIES: Opr family porin [Arcobacteraceae]|uniref:Porin domain-containing protein n=1 Tax=Poseidonibacter parvus TaxID=1850254 RepID=A0A1P8KP10_9BACT|nr:MULTISPECIES: Opr family porin [Arcobacteraceae]APW66342.1 hypothetical protein LPB137_11025 [Poseidonibacter parvus]
MKKQLSIITSAVILSTSFAYAESENVNEAFKNGSVSGDLSAYTQQVDDGTSKSGFSSATFGLNYETGSVNGFSAQAGFRANHELSSKNDGDYNGEFANNALMTLANIKYSNNIATIIAGRQEIDLEWIGDYNDALLAKLTPMDNLEITAAFARRQAAAGVDESTDFEKIGEDGVYLIDAKFEALKGLVLNPYFYEAKDVASYYGLKATFDNDMFGLTGHYAQSNEDDNSIKDASIYNLEARTSVANLDLALGYIKTDEDISSIATAGDNIDPTEEIGDSVYATDSKTIYASAGYTIADIELSAGYAQAKYSNNKDKEFVVGAGYSFVENLSAEVLYVDYEIADVDQSKVAATLTYEF